MTLKIKSFSATTDWFFVPLEGGKPYRLAGFAVIEGTNEERDAVVGMVPVRGGSDEDDVAAPVLNLCRLTTVPPQKGSYRHISTLEETIPRPT